MFIYPTRRGSMYLITLITVAAVVSMVLIGVQLRSMGNQQGTFVEQMTLSSSGVMTAAEIAIESISGDPKWALNAQGGVVYSAMPIGDFSFVSSVTDASTDAKPTYETGVYRVHVSSLHGSVVSKARLDLQASKYDYTTHLRKTNGIHYWPLQEAVGALDALELISSDDGVYQDSSVSGAGTNDEGALVPVFANSNDYVEVPWNSDLVQPNGAVAFWMNFSGSSKTEVYGITGMEYQLGGGPTLSVVLWNNTLMAYVSNTAKLNYDHLATTSLGVVERNVWHHIAVTWGAKGLRVYIDGVQEAQRASNTVGVTTERAAKGGEQPLRIGSGFQLSPFSQPAKGFEGSIAHYAYFDQQLTAIEVEALARVKPDTLSFAIVEGSWFREFD